MGREGSTALDARACLANAAESTDCLTPHSPPLSLSPLLDQRIHTPPPSQMRASLLVSLLLVCLVSAVSGVQLSGRVSSLSGEAEKGVTVRAVLTGAAAATPIEVQTDASGAYTFPTLVPGEYKVEVATGGEADAAGASRIARASPSSSTVTLTSADVSSVDFLSFRKPTKFDLTGEIVGLAADGKHLHTLDIQLALASNPGAVVHTTKVLADLPYFEFLSLPAETYVLTVKTSLSTRTYSFTASSLTIPLTSQSVHVRPVVDISYKMSSVHEMQSNSIWSTLLLLAAVAAIIYKEKSLAIARGALRTLQTRNPTHLRSAFASLTSSGPSGAASFEVKPTATSAKVDSEDKTGRKAKFQKEKKTHVSTFVRYDSLPLAQQPQTEQSVAPPSPVAVVREPVVRAAAPKKEKPTPVVKETPPAPAVAVEAPTPAPAAAKKQPAPKQQEKATPKVAAKPVVEKVVEKVEAVVEKATAPAATVVAAAAAAPPAAAGGAKFCASCGNKRPDSNAKFCSECGSKY